MAGLANCVMTISLVRKKCCMPSFKYVIELSDQDKATLMEIVKKGNSPAISR